MLANILEPTDGKNLHRLRGHDVVESARKKFAPTVRLPLHRHGLYRRLHRAGNLSNTLGRAMVFRRTTLEKKRVENHIQSFGHEMGFPKRRVAGPKALHRMIPENLYCRTLVTIRR